MLAAARDQQLPAIACNLADQLAGVGVHDLRPQRHRQEQILALLAGTVTAAALPAALRAELAGVAVIGQRVQAFAPNEINVAAVAAVAAVRPAERDEFLAPERQRAVAAATGLHAYADFVDELHMSFCRKDAKTRRKEGQNMQKPRSLQHLASPAVDVFFKNMMFSAPLRLCDK